MVRPQSMSTGRVVPDRLLTTHLARTLFSAQRESRTGVLTVDEGPVQTKLHIVDGRVIFAERGTLAETLGRLLVRQGTMDRDEYALVLEHMAKPSERDEIMRFGEVAIQLGMLTASELGAALGLQVRMKLQHCLQLDEAVWMWVDDESPRRTAPFPVPLEPAVRSALREDPQAYRWAGLLVAKRRMTVRLAGAPDALGRRFGVSPEELRLLKHADGRPLATVLQSGILQSEETGALIAALLFGDGLTLVEPVPSEIPPARPPRAPSQSSPHHRAQEAAERLRLEMERRGKAMPDPQRGRLDAERAFEAGRKLLRHGNVEGAQAKLAEAVALLPEAAEYVLYLRWCAYLTDTDPMRKVVHEQQLRDAVLEGLRQDRKMAFAHYVQGRLFLIDEDETAARKAFAIAVHLDRSDLEATRYLRLLDQRKG